MPRKPPALGPNTQIIVDMLEAALDYAETPLSDYYPCYCADPKYGVGLLISQTPVGEDYCKDMEEPDLDDFVMICEQGLVAECGEGTCLMISDEQPAHKVGALLVAALLTAAPIAFPQCPHCAAPSS